LVGRDVPCHRRLHPVIGGFTVGERAQAEGVRRHLTALFLRPFLVPVQQE
jgi:hypothetical protein